MLFDAVFYSGAEALKKRLWWKGKWRRRRSYWALRGKGMWLQLWQYKENLLWTKKLPWRVRSRTYWVDGQGLLSVRRLQWNPRRERTWAVVVGPLLTDKKKCTALHLLHLCQRAMKKWRKSGAVFLFFCLFLKRSRCKSVDVWFHLNPAWICVHIWSVMPPHPLTPDRSGFFQSWMNIKVFFFSILLQAWPRCGRREEKTWREKQRR